MKYDFTFSGLGLSTMLVLNEMFENDVLVGKRVLIIEPNDIGYHEKTWSYWEEKNGKWDEYISSKWYSALFKNENKSIECLNEELVYKQFESKQFIESLFIKLKMSVDITLLKEKFISFNSNDLDVEIITEKASYYSEYFFSSVFKDNNYKSSFKYPLLNQHFIGWFVETDEPLFDSKNVIFMDFTVEQKQNTRFMYVLPFTKNKALVEYTLFSKDLLSEQEYEREIKLYLIKLGITGYSISKKEKGNIPMTVYPFWKSNEKRVLYIGSAGGWTKASTGYTFKNSVRKASQVVSFLKQENVDFRKFQKWNKYHFYDSLFIDVLYFNNYLGKEVFSSMFSKVDPKLILKFLDENTTLIEDFKIIMACPKLPFLIALLKKVIK
jgi:lycopene beta-cyclase